MRRLGKRLLLGPAAILPLACTTPEAVLGIDPDEVGDQTLTDTGDESGQSENEESTHGETSDSDGDLTSSVPGDDIARPRCEELGDRRPYGRCDPTQPYPQCDGNSLCGYYIEYPELSRCLTPCESDLDCPPPPGDGCPTNYGCVAGYCDISCADGICPEGLGCYYIVLADAQVCF